MLETQRRRTPQSHAAFFLPHLQTDTNLLDVGCGPGNLTAGFAALCPSGQVTGVDLGSDIIAQATATYGDKAVFRQADVYHLPFADNSFDAVHANQVFQYLSNVPAALKELYRVVRRGGVVGLRAASFRHSLASPDCMDLFNDTFSRSIEVTGGSPEIGLELPALMNKAGSREVTSSVSHSHYCGKDREINAQDWLGSLDEGGLAKKWVDLNVAKETEIDVIRTGFERLLHCETGFYSVPNVQVLGWK